MKLILILILFSILLFEILSTYQVTCSDRRFRPRNGQKLECGIQKVECRETGCSSNLNSRIIGGSQTFKGEFPWLTSLTMSQTRNQFCAGTLLDAQHVLTANHCVFDFDIMKLARLRVILGDYNIRTTTDGRHEERRVSKVFSHPNWNIRTNENDIAILKLRRPVNFTDYIFPICLGGMGPQKLFEDDQTFATIVGWGRTNLRNKQKSPIPLKAAVPLTDHEECRKRYLPFLVSKTMMCAGGNGKDGCLGDSGGPLMLKNLETERWEQIGIISWGNSCHELPGVYTNIESHLPFILSTLKASNYNYQSQLM